MEAKAPLAALVLAVSAALCGCGGSGGGGSARLEWPVMGTVAAVQARGCEPTLARDAAKPVFAEVERLLNAHDPNSELSSLAKLDDAEVLAKCTPSMRPCYEAAFRMREESGGVFNPRWRGPGTMDLGAIAKGFAVDLAAERMRGAGAAAKDGTLLDLGGNLKAGGGSRAWRTGIADPSGNGYAWTIDLEPGEAVATSAEYYRGRHIRDPRTGQPAGAGVASVSVKCRSAMMADGLSTALFVLGPDEGRAFLDRSGFDAEAFFIMKDGRRIRFASRP